MMKAYKKYCPTYELMYSARRLIGSRIIESAAYCNHILMAPLYLNSTQNTLPVLLLAKLAIKTCHFRLFLLKIAY